MGGYRVQASWVNAADGGRDWTLSESGDEVVFRHAERESWPALLARVAGERGWTLADVGFESEWEMALFRADFGSAGP